jgi:hypothetical protein
MTFVNGAGNGNASNNGLITVAVPAGVVDGDFMLACVGYGATAASCAGWTPFDTGGAFNATMLWRIASSEPANYTFSGGGSGFMEGAIVAYRGPTSIDDFKNQITVPPSPMATQSLTATGAGDYVVLLFGQNSGNVPHFTTTGGTLTKDFEFDYSFLATSIAAMSRPIAGAGSTGPDAYSTGSSDGVVVFSIELLGVACVPPVNTVAPVASGEAKQGEPLSVTDGTWTGDATISFGYQWFRDCGSGPVAIIGATANSYLLTSHDVGCFLDCVVTGTNGCGSSDGTSNTLGPVTSDVIPPATLPYRSPAWRFVVLDLVTFETLSFLDVVATGRAVNYTLDAPTQAQLVVPSDDPEVSIPWPDPDSDPFLTEGSRVLVGMRRDGIYPEVWTPRFSGIIMQLEDTAQSDIAYSHVTAFDPWQYLLSRPVCNADGTLPGTNGISFSATDVDVIIGTLLANTIANQGMCGIDMGVAYNGTSFYDGTVETCPAVDINFQQGTSVGQAWSQLTAQNDCDIILTPIYDPVNRPGYMVQANVYTQAGTERDDAIFAWDLPSRSLVQISRLQDGTLRANKVKFFAGQGGSATGGQSIPVQTDAASVAKYGEYWRQQFFPGQTVASIVQLLAASELAISKTGRLTVTISPAPERSPIPFDDYWLGDRVPVYASSKLRAPLQGYQRVYGVPLAIADDQTESVQQLLTTEPS